MGGSLFAQNLILNPNFEDGPLPADQGDIDYATHWDQGCNLSINPDSGADLYDIDITNEDICKFDVPDNRWFYDLYGRIGNRYAGFSGAGFLNQNGPNDYGESILGTLDGPLVNCLYTFKIHVASPERSYFGNQLGNCDGPNSPFVPGAGRALDIVLRKSGNCTAEEIVLTFDIGPSSNWVAYEGSFTLSQAAIAVGYDRIEIRSATTSYAVRVVIDALSLEASPNGSAPILTLNGPNTICYNQAMNFSGNLSNGMFSSTLWEIQESNANGNVIEGGFLWGLWVAGQPGNYTFPLNVDPPCGKYYRVKVAGVDPCYGWRQTTQVIYVNCLPSGPKGGNVPICGADCVELNGKAVFQLGYQYAWYANNTSVGGNSPNYTACKPGNYVLIITDIYTGCTSTTNFNVYEENTDPSWSHSINTNNSNYYNISAIGNELNTSGINGFGYAWEIRVYNEPGGSSCGVFNPYCWWVHPSVTNFRGYKGTSDCTINCNLNVAGRFYYGKYYEITRGTWSKNCPWTQQTQLIYVSKPGANFVQPEITSYEIELPSKEKAMRTDFTEQPTAKYASSTLKVYPNPNNGEWITISASNLGLELEEVKIEIFHMNGQLVYETNKKLDRGQLKTEIVFANKLASGIYFVKVLSGGDIQTKKIIIP